jgi:CubicO group peptidase (beta-lactamase class C family)
MRPTRSNHPRHLTGLACGAALMAMAVVTACSGGGARASSGGELPAVTAAMDAAVARNEVAGAVTAVVTLDGFAHLGAVGFADREAGRPMAPDTLFWIASMTKPITATAVLMLQDEGRLSVDDPVAKYLPELAGMRTAEGAGDVITLRHLLTHSSGLAEVTGEPRLKAHTLAELVTLVAPLPLQFVPGSRWQYCQSGINALGRIVEVVSGKSFPDFLAERLFIPLGMRDTGFAPTAEQQARLAKPYRFVGGGLAPASFYPDFDPTRPGRVPAANGGLFSTAPDYARFCRMILGKGSLGGKRYLSEQAVALMTSVQSGALVTGFTPGNGWGLGWCVVRQPQGVSAALSPGSFGHGGAFGTQVWIDPARQVAYVLMVSRANFPNSDGSDIRRDFQNAALAGLGR